MQITVDNQIIKILRRSPGEVVKNLLFADPNNSISFRWPSLLEYLDLGSILTNLPQFHTSPLYKICLETLCTSEEKEVCFHLYDSLFIECLNQVKAIPQINASFLLRAIKICRQLPSFFEAEKVISSTLTFYEKALIEKSSQTLHDLIFYLAWDRMCVCMSSLFDYQSLDQKLNNGLIIIRECLIESFLHITKDGKTSPSLYRLIESLFFCEIREKNLQTHTEKAWETLSKSFQILTAQNELPDFFYIDDAVVPVGDQKNESDNLKCYHTLDSPEKVNIRLELASYMTDRLKWEFPDWDFGLQHKKIIYHIL